jgi:hypothetical protein
MRGASKKLATGLKRKNGRMGRYVNMPFVMLTSYHLTGRLERALSARMKKTQVRLHKEILEDKLGRGIRRGYVTDHVDGDGLNNRRSNLREAANGQNKANQHPVKQPVYALRILPPPAPEVALPIVPAFTFVLVFIVLFLSPAWIAGHSYRFLSL